MQEPEGLAEGVGAAVIKSLVWEGRLKYDTVVKEDGEMVGKHIEKEGPTGLIVCTTRPLEEQISNRLLRVEVDASEQQTRRILMSIARSAAGNGCSIDFTAWHAMSQVLGGDSEVVVLFGAFLAERVSVSTLRIRRDFTHLLTLIGACAIEHRFQRPVTSGRSGSGHGSGLCHGPFSGGGDISSSPGGGHNVSRQTDGSCCHRNDDPGWR